MEAFEVDRGASEATLVAVLVLIVVFCLGGAVGFAAAWLTL